MPLLKASDEPPRNVAYVGVAIQDVRPGQFHCGLIYRIGNDPTRYLHLAFHHLLTDEPAQHTLRWGELGLDEDNKLVLATFLSRIAKVNPKISYAFDAEGVCIDRETGDLLPAPPGKGLTCATFVNAALKAYGYDCIDFSTWPSRDDDEKWQETILKVLRQHADQEHVQLVEQSIGAKRLRPDEIVGAAIIDAEEWSVNFDESRRAADQILADLAAS